MKGGYLIVGLAFYLATGPAVAQPAYTPQSLAVSYAKGWRPMQPPPEFSGPYTGELTVNHIPLAEISAACKNLPRVVGCSYWAQGSHLVPRLPSQ